MAASLMQDVVESQKMVKLDFLHFTNAPSEDALPDEINPLTNERHSHNESTLTMGNQERESDEQKEQGSRNYVIRFHW